MTILYLKMHKGPTNLHNQFQPDLIINKGVRVIFMILRFSIKDPPIWKIPKHVQGGFKGKSLRKQTHPPIVDNQTLYKILWAFKTQINKL